MDQTSGLECVLDARCVLGEGPVWRDGALWFVDIKQNQVHRFDPASGAHRTWTAPSAPGFLAPMAGDGLWIAGLKTGLHSFDSRADAFDLLLEVEDPALGNRLNDGSVDAKGRLWFGSMHDAETNLTGALYRFDRRGLQRMDDGYCITNGPMASPDGRTFYHTDTVARTIYAFDLAEDGALSGRRVFVRLEEGAGSPDGTAVDAEGCVWSALWGGWGVRRYSPAGELLQTVRLPVSNVTKIAFGGPDLTSAYATSARAGLSAEALQAQPLAGGVFRFAVDVPGLAAGEVAEI